MGLFEHFPYTNFHELNIDWVLRKIKRIPEAAPGADGWNVIRFPGGFEIATISTRLDFGSYLDPDDFENYSQAFVTDGVITGQSTSPSGMQKSGPIWIDSPFDNNSGSTFIIATSNKQGVFPGCSASVYKDGEHAGKFAVFIDKVPYSYADTYPINIMILHMPV